jgi:2-oxoglutarate dehydrogenase complex dehydrogenase (E1) component-like enzyme
MGAWQHMERHFRALLASVEYIGRPADACPAVASHHVHAEQQAEILRQAYGA